jgi:hypothetical protein
MVISQGMHLSSGSICFHANLLESGNNHWLGYEKIRIEVDFDSDQIRIFGNNVLKVVNDDTHKPSDMKTCYITFMFYNAVTLSIEDSKQEK